MPLKSGSPAGNLEATLPLVMPPWSKEEGRKSHQHFVIHNSSSLKWHIVSLYKQAKLGLIRSITPRYTSGYTPDTQKYYHPDIHLHNQIGSKDQNKFFKGIWADCGSQSCYDGFSSCWECLLAGPHTIWKRLDNSFLAFTLIFDKLFNGQMKQWNMMPI